MKRIMMTHYSDPTGSYTPVSEKAFREHWQLKGWVTDDPAFDRPQQDHEPNTTTTEE